MLDAGKLATLRAVVEHGSFSAAAAELALTQPAVSRQVSALEAQAGTQLLRRTRLGSFFTALVHVSAQLSVVLEERHPDLFRMQPQVIEDRLVDRRAAFRGLAAGELDLAVVFEHSF